MSDSNETGMHSVGIYVRESRDDNEENIETLETQRDLLVDFIKRSRLGNIFRIYIDDNVTGSAFERKGIETLKQDVIKRNISLLVMKDLSRLGRNNAKTLLFLDFLEEHGVRVMTFDGRYDSIRDNDTVGIDTWFNERYIRDISRKIRYNLRFKIEKGEYIGHAPYGYRKSTEEKNKLKIDEPNARVVREIYRLYREGYGYGYIARQLDREGYPPPSCKEALLKQGKQWNAVAIQRILCNRVYIGDTVQGVSEKVSFKSKKTRRLPLSKWVITRNTHEPIISEEEFEEIQKIRAGKRIASGSHKGNVHVFKGLLYCGGCGTTMYARVRKGRPIGYICGNYSKNGLDTCTSHFVREDWLIDIVRCELIRLLRDKGTAQKLEAMINKKFFDNGRIARQLAALEQQIFSRQRQQDTLYSDRLEGKISEQLFSRTNQGIENKIIALKNELEKLKTKKENDISPGKIIDNTIDEIEEKGITREIAALMIDKILIIDPHEDYAHVPELIKGTMNSDEIEQNGAVIIRFKFSEI